MFYANGAVMYCGDWSDDLKEGAVAIPSLAIAFMLFGPTTSNSSINLKESASSPNRMDLCTKGGFLVTRRTAKARNSNVLS